MSQPLVALSDLKTKFSQFDRIAEITGELQRNLEVLNQYNRDAAGQNDAVAGAYHGQVDTPTKGLVDLVNGLQTSFGLTGTNGKDVVDTLVNADGNAQDLAKGWQT
jgi:hypothetical protein